MRLINTEWKGIVWDPYNWDSASDEAISDAKQIAAAGIKWARLWFRADEKWDYIDNMVNLCKENGIKIIACWNKENPTHDLGDATQQEQQVNVLKTAVERYKNDIHYWEIHNEANLISFWNNDFDAYKNGTETGRGSTDPNSIYNQGAHRYVQWLQLAYNAVKEKAPTATVILGGISEWVMEDFMDRLTVEKAYLYFDEVAFHPYAENMCPYPSKCIERLNSFKSKMVAWPAPYNDKPIWITEIGFHVSDIDSAPPGLIPDKDGQLDEATKAQYLYQTIVLLIQNLKHKRPISWYIYHENISSSGYGLVRKYKSAESIITEYKEAYYMYKSMDKSWDYYKTTD